MFKESFYIYQEDLVKIVPTEEGKCVSEIVQCLNTYCMTNMKKLRTTQITNYMVDKGYLCEDERGIKRPTLRGRMLGISMGKRKNESNEEFSVNVYSKKAQMYIYDHLYEMLLK